MAILIYSDVAKENRLSVIIKFYVRKSHICILKEIPGYICRLVINSVW